MYQVNISVNYEIGGANYLLVLIRSPKSESNVSTLISTCLLHVFDGKLFVIWYEFRIAPYLYQIYDITGGLLFIADFGWLEPFFSHKDKFSENMKQISPRSCQLA